jgi:hypothetical protein
MVAPQIPKIAIKKQVCHIEDDHINVLLNESNSITFSYDFNLITTEKSYNCTNHQTD